MGSARTGKSAAAALAVALSLLGSCTLQRLESREAPGFRLAPPSAKCRPALTHHRYYLLFGAFPSPWLGAPDPAMMAGNSPRRFAEMVTPIDVAITVLGGWALTLTRRTVIMEICDESPPAPVTAGPAAAVTPAWSEQVLRSIMGGSEANFHLNDGRKLRGKVAHVEANSVTIVTTETRRGSGPVDRIVRRDGRVIEGSILTQDGGAVSIRRNDSLRLVVPKGKIRRIQYGVVPVRTIKREHKVKIDEVKRISLP